MRELVDGFVEVYQKTNICEPSDVEVMTHLEYQGRSDVVSWIKLVKHFKFDELYQRGVSLVELADVVM